MQFSGQATASFPAASLGIDGRLALFEFNRFLSILDGQINFGSRRAVFLCFHPRVTWNAPVTGAMDCPNLRFGCDLAGAFLTKIPSFTVRHKDAPPRARRRGVQLAHVEEGLFAE